MVDRLFQGILDLINDCCEATTSSLIKSLTHLSALRSIRGRISFQTLPHEMEQERNPGSPGGFSTK
jgi:hypothetical protein